MNNKTCSRCQKTFQRPAHLREHLARKTPCAPILDLADIPDTDPQKKCQFCGRVFTTYTSKQRHIRKTCKIAPNAKNGDTGMEILYKHMLNKQQAEIDELKAQVQLLTSVCQKTGGSVAANQLTSTVPIAAFGQEEFEHVTRDHILAVFDKCILLPSPAHAARAALIEIATLLFGDPDHPQNLTCFLPNQKGTTAVVHTADGWETRSLSLVLTDIAMKTMKELFLKQPCINYRKYTAMVKELKKNNAHYETGTTLLPVLIRNKKLLASLLGAVPQEGVATG